MPFRNTGSVLRFRHSPGHPRALVCLFLGLLLAACAPTPIFPPEVHDKVDRTVTFENLASNPDQYIDRTVELGGQILGSIAEHNEVHMLARRLHELYSLRTLAFELPRTPPAV